MVLGIAVLIVRRLDAKTSNLHKSLVDFERHSPTPSMVTDDTGKITHRNVAAEALNPEGLDSQSIEDCISHFIADPNTVIYRLKNQLEAQDWVTSQFNTRSHRISFDAKKLKNGCIFWRAKEESKLKHVAANAMGLTVSVGRNGTVLSISEHLVELLGQKPKNLKDFVVWKDGDIAGPCQIKTKAGGKTYFCTSRQILVGRREISLFELPSKNESPNNPFDALPIPVLQLDLAGKVLAVNSSASNFIQNTALEGQLFHELFEGVGRPLIGWVSEVGETEDGSGSQFARITANSKDKFIQVNLSRIDDAGEVRFLAVLSDATELKTLEAQFVQSQKMQAIGQLAGGVAHDFNNLLTAISGHCDLLLLRHDESDSDFADLDQIRQNSNRAAALVRQLLAFSRKQTLQPQPIDLEQTLADHTHLLNRLVGEKIQLLLHHGRSLKRISADKRQFEQIIMNLVVNARDAMDGHGTISVSTSMRTYARLERRDRALIPPGEYCVITVSDQGCGIAADKLQHIFEPFYTSKPTGEGTGLGLSTVYGIVKQSGGFIFVESARGVGTSFELLFPAFDGKSSSLLVTEKTKPEEAISNRAEGVVLLVEDEIPVRAFASRALKIKGFTVLEAANAEEALDILRDDKLAVDIFVTDVVMPGKDGPSWVSEALIKRPETKVVFVSGYAENRCDELSENIPNSIFLPKPFSLSQLTSTVARLH